MADKKRKQNNIICIMLFVKNYLLRKIQFHEIRHCNAAVIKIAEAGSAACFMRLCHFYGITFQRAEGERGKRMESVQRAFAWPRPPISLFICIDSDDQMLCGRVENLECRVRVKGTGAIMHILLRVSENKNCFSAKDIEWKKGYRVRPGRICTLQVQIYGIQNSTVQGQAVFLQQRNRIEYPKVIFRSEIELIRLVEEAVEFVKQRQESEELPREAAE